MAPIKPTPSIPPITTASRSIIGMKGTSTATVHNVYRTEIGVCQEALDCYLLYCNATKFLVKQIASTVPLLFLEELTDIILKFRNINPFSLLNHLKLNMG